MLIFQFSQKGEKNSQFGTHWIHDISMQISIKIKKEEFEKYLSKGWIRGRCKKSSLEEICLRRFQIQNERKQQIINDNIKKYSELHDLYVIVGFKEFVLRTNYSQTQANLVQMFLKHVPHFKSQNGKKRGKSFRNILTGKESHC